MITDPVYPDSVQIWAELNSVWTDISSDANSSIKGSWGIEGNTPVDRIASTGHIEFTLNNTTGKYSPGLAGSLAGWKKGTLIKLIINFQSEAYVRFYGRVDDITIDSGTFGKRNVRVTAVDWMDFTTRTSMRDQAIQVNKRGDEIINAIVSAVPIQPINELYDTGENTFPAAFDSITDNSDAFTEMNKVSLSELGFVYLNKDREFGETLVFEAAGHRSGLHQPSEIPLVKSLSGKLLQETGEYLLQETGDKILLNESTTFEVDNTMQKIDTVYGDYLLNQVTVRAYPKKVDTSASVLFFLDEPVLIPSGKTVYLSAKFTDQTSGLSVNGRDMITPVATTDYLMNSLANGSGTNYTSDLTVTATYYSQGVDFALYNANANAGYVTKLQTRGYKITYYGTIDSISESADSISEYGYSPIQIDQKLQPTLDRGILAGDTYVDLNKDPRTVLDRVHLQFNNSSDLAQAFLSLDVGSMVSVKENQTGINGWYYIDSVSFDISLGGIIKYQWGVRETINLGKGLSPVKITFGGYGTRSAVNFGYLPEVSNLMQKTITYWINAPSQPTGSLTPYLMGTFTDEGGWIAMMGQFTRKSLFAYKFKGGQGQWSTASGTIVPDTTYFVAVTYDASDPFANDPTIYVNGVSKALVEDAHPTGSFVSEDGMNFVFGNVKTATLDYNRPLLGTMWDHRIYNRILTSDEITSIYNSGTVTDGLVLQIPCIKTRDTALYDGQALTEDMKLLDNIRLVVGTPIDDPTCEVL